mmetsp:Transcript_27532/g.58163  ORF Transcript_27532/g.58163 Transcript_27532/m.58163 type:complete len:82 (+) Transcript_27532:67-312(+)
MTALSPEPGEANPAASAIRRLIDGSDGTFTSPSGLTSPVQLFSQSQDNVVLQAEPPSDNNPKRPASPRKTSCNTASSPMKK